jgi:hypothetical protein
VTSLYLARTCREPLQGALPGWKEKTLVSAVAASPKPHTLMGMLPPPRIASTVRPTALTTRSYGLALDDPVSCKHLPLNERAPVQELDFV